MPDAPFPHLHDPQAAYEHAQLVIPADQVIIEPAPGLPPAILPPHRAAIRWATAGDIKDAQPSSLRQAATPTAVGLMRVAGLMLLATLAVVLVIVGVWAITHPMHVVIGVLTVLASICVTAILALTGGRR